MAVIAPATKFLRLKSITGVRQEEMVVTSMVAIWSSSKDHALGHGSDQGGPAWNSFDHDHDDLSGAHPPISHGVITSPVSKTLGFSSLKTPFFIRRTCIYFPKHI